MVFLVYGKVGFVEAGRIFASPASSMMSGACPPPAPSVWKVWITRPAMASLVLSTKPASFRGIGVAGYLDVVFIGDF